MSYKISKYTFLLPQEDECTVLYNCRTEAIAVIENEKAQLLSMYSDDLETVQKQHPAFYEFLTHKQFAVSSEINEEEELIQKWELEDNNPKSFGLFINPTLDCNLNCWYCFEKHIKGSLVNDDVSLAISKLIERKVTLQGVKYLSLCFFGGEPLIAFKSFVVPLLKKTNILCQEYGCQLHVGFVTNATLITNEMLDWLQSLHTMRPIIFQITLDGNEQMHNQTKVFPNKKGSYRLILENIRKILTHKMHITLRLNMTNENIESFYDVMDDISTLSFFEKELITIDLQRVWQDAEKGNLCDFEETQTNIRNAFVSEGFKVNELKHIDNSRCYADRENHISINYDGRLFKCTACDFTANNSEGILSNDGLMMWNEKYAKRMQHRYGNDFCRMCRIFPLCHGGCSQHKLNTLHIKNQCIRNYDELYIQKIIEDRVDYLLDKLTQTKKVYEKV